MKKYKEWVIRGDNTRAKCKVCPVPRNKTELWAKGPLKVTVLIEKYCERLAVFKKNCRTSFSPLPKQSVESPSTASSLASCSTYSKKLDTFFVPEAFSDAEVRWSWKKNILIFHTAFVMALPRQFYSSKVLFVKTVMLSLH